jgi:hypothetical protein
MDGGGVKLGWERDQALLGLARETPDEEFARGGLAALAVEPTVRIIVLPPDEKGSEELALRFGARVDLAFGGPGTRHLDRDGSETGRFNPSW